MIWADRGTQRFQDGIKRTADLIIRYWLPVGWISLLTGMFWIGDRSLYTKLFYITLATPTLLVLLIQPQRIKPFTKNPIIIIFLIFATYMMLSVIWAQTGETPITNIKRPLYILMLFFSAAMLATSTPRLLEKAIEISGIIAATSAALSLCYFFYTQKTGRFSGYGALENALVASHVYAFFATYWLCRWYTHQKSNPILPIAAFSILFILILFTGSRTPIAALFAAAIWLFLIDKNPKIFIAIIFSIGLYSISILITIFLEKQYEAGDLLARGTSYRPQIWLETLQILKAHPWFGLGYGHPLILSEHIQLQAKGNPHNMFLQVLFSGGIFGALIWLSLYCAALVYCLKNKSSITIITTSTLLIFGFFSGLTEGSSVMSRPKEHWFQIWIPLALIFGTWISLDNHKPASKSNDELSENA